jgi:hypothetical protein
VIGVGVGPSAVPTTPTIPTAPAPTVPTTLLLPLLLLVLVVLLLLLLLHVCLPSPLLTPWFMCTHPVLDLLSVVPYL